MCAVDLDDLRAERPPCTTVGLDDVDACPWCSLGGGTGEPCARHREHLLTIGAPHLAGTIRR